MENCGTVAKLLQRLQSCRMASAESKGLIRILIIEPSKFNHVLDWSAFVFQHPILFLSFLWHDVSARKRTCDSHKSLGPGRIVEEGTRQVGRMESYYNPTKVRCKTKPIYPSMCSQEQNFYFFSVGRCSNFLKKLLLWVLVKVSCLRLLREKSFSTFCLPTWCFPERYWVMCFRHKKSYCLLYVYWWWYLCFLASLSKKICLEA